MSTGISKVFGALKNLFSVTCLLLLNYTSTPKAPFCFSSSGLKPFRSRKEKVRQLTAQKERAVLVKENQRHSGHSATV